MASLLGLIQRNRQVFSPPEVPKAENALRFGILGAANIAPLGLIWPAKSHPEVIIQAVAARDKQRAVAYAKKHGIPQVLDDYKAIIDDPTIDAVYIPLPNGLHFEWALRALAKGKHVLLEKPSVSNAKEAELLFRSPLLTRPLGDGQGPPVLLEAFHYRFQPTWQHFLSLIDRSNVESAYSALKLPFYSFGQDDIRFKYELSGGSLMDCGTYPMSSLRDIFGSEPETCLDSTIQPCAPPNELCDATALVRFRFPNGGVGTVDTGLRSPGLLPSVPYVTVTHRPQPVSADDIARDKSVKVPDGYECVRIRHVTLHNFIVSALWHRIDVDDEYVVRKVAADGSVDVAHRSHKKHSEKVYSFREASVNKDQPSEVYWTSYRHQLEQFVNRIRGRPGSGLWISAEDSIAEARIIDSAYEKGGLPLRPTSSFRLE